MKYIYVFMLVLLMSSQVSAYAWLESHAISSLEYTLTNLYGMVKGVVKSLILIGAIVGLIFVLQYVGIDVIGVSFSIITNTIDVFFTVVAQVTSREESLISAVVLFIIAMAVLLGML